jgi:H+/Cl- antiporter ClcA/predicted transcriptional regulator
MHSLRGDFAANRRLLLIAAIALGIGLIAAFVAYGLLALIHLFTNLFYFHQFSLAAREPAGHALGWLAASIPVLGGLIVGLMARYGSERIRGHGIPEALEAILFGKSILQPKIALLKPLSSAIAIGSGGPFGAEGPIIMTGGAFGSIVAQWFHLTAAERKTLLVAGACAGMTAVFGTPIAAVLFAVELLLFEWRPRSLVPVAIACAAAAAVRPWLLGAPPLFPVESHEYLGAFGLIAAAGVGLVAGVFSSLVTAALYKVEDAFGRLKLHWMWWPALGGVAVGVLGWIEPRALGVGYEVIGDLLHGNVALRAAALLVAVKCAMWLIALGSGTSGGVMAPMLIFGACLGTIESSVLPAAGAGLWPLVSMAAILGGMMRVPFTAVLFAFELTLDVHALPPLLVAAITAYAFTVLVMKRSILTEKVARRGYDLFREYMVDPLERVRVGEIMTRDVMTIPGSTTVAELLDRHFGGSRKHRGYPVVDDDGRLVGVLTGASLIDLPDTVVASTATAQDLVRTHPVVVDARESCRVAAERMATAGVGRLPVVAPDDPARVVGIVTRSDLLKPRLRHLDEEHRRERVMGRR